VNRPGFERVMAFAAGVWPTAEISEETAHAWRLKLDRFDDTLVTSVLFELAATEKFLPSLSTLYQGCIDTGNRAAIAADAEQRELTAFSHDPDDWRDRQWNALPPDEQAQWFTKAREQWPAWLKIRDDSPVLRANAAAMARGVDMHPLPLPLNTRPPCECGAVLLPGFDPPGRYCRNCAPKHRKATEMKR
jgi:hypothetical protein